jgi:hypothetical protein
MPVCAVSTERWCLGASTCKQASESPSKPDHIAGRRIDCMPVAWAQFRVSMHKAHPNQAPCWLPQGKAWPWRCVYQVYRSHVVQEPGLATQWMRLVNGSYRYKKMKNRQKRKKNTRKGTNEKNVNTRARTQCMILAHTTSLHASASCRSGHKRRGPTVATRGTVAIFWLPGARNARARVALGSACGTRECQS